MGGAGLQRVQHARELDRSYPAADKLHQSPRAGFRPGGTCNKALTVNANHPPLLALTRDIYRSCGV
jgi:hypothetical protein